MNTSIHTVFINIIILIYKSTPIMYLMYLFFAKIVFSVSIAIALHTWCLDGIINLTCT